MLKLRTSLGRSFRVPTYTELYYNTAANKGNPALSPEKSWSYEVGLDWTRQSFSWGATLFRREGDNLIDWVRATSSDPWETKNINAVETNGLEISYTLNPRQWNKSSPFSHISLGYTCLDADRDESSLQSKYVMNYLEHQVSCTVNHSLPAKIRQVWKLNYAKRVNGNSYFLLATRLVKKFGDSEIFIDGTNLFNTSYEEVGGVPMPGRWIKVGIKIEF